MDQQNPQLDNFQFRGLHPNVFLGTASDRYKGWIGQIYSGRLYEERINRRSKKIRGKTFVEEVLPVESVREYFRHFSILELDFTFYRPLLDEEGKATQNMHVLRKYTQYLNKDDRLILKVPQTVFAKKIWHRGSYVKNENYLNPGAFTRQFYEPALGVSAAWLKGFIFEQEYQRRQERSSSGTLAEELDNFFASIPNDTRYHVEIRTESLLSKPVFTVLERHGIGQILSHWTWLPQLSRQFAMSAKKFMNRGKKGIIRLLTPRGMRYEDAYAKAHPFSSLVDGMMDPQMVDQTVEIMRSAIKDEVQINVIVNNRAGGNAPIIAQKIARQFLTGQTA